MLRCAIGKAPLPYQKGKLREVGGSVARHFRHFDDCNCRFLGAIVGNWGALRPGCLLISDDGKSLIGGARMVLPHLEAVRDPLRDHPRFQALLEKYEVD